MEHNFTTFNHSIDPITLPAHPKILRFYLFIRYCFVYHVTTLFTLLLVAKIFR